VDSFPIHEHFPDLLLFYLVVVYDFGLCVDGVDFAQVELYDPVISLRHRPNFTILHVDMPELGLSDAREGKLLEFEGL